MPDDPRIHATVRPAPRHAATRTDTDRYVSNQRTCALLLKLSILAAAVDLVMAVTFLLAHAPHVATLVGINFVMFACLAAFLLISMDRRARQYRAGRAAVDPS